MKIINNNIYIERGETTAINFKAWNMDGTPFVLPPVPVRSLQAIAITTVNETSVTETTYTFRLPYKLGKTTSFTVKLASDGAVVFKYGMSADNISIQRVELNADNNYEATVNIGSNLYLYSISTTAQLDALTFDDIVYSADINRALVSVLALTVRAADRDTVVLEKYLNLQSGIMYDGKVDSTFYGWNKFVTQQAHHLADSSQILSWLASNGRFNPKLCEYDGIYYHYADIGSGEAWPYEFAMSLPLLFEDTAHLHNGEYKYDIAVYQGYINSVDRFKDNEFPFKEVVWKKSIIVPHKFVIMETNNA